MKNEPIVKSVKFEYPPDIFDGKAKAVLEMDDGSVEIMEFFHDEIQFTEDELIGRTFRECLNLYTKKDIEFLRS